MGVFRALRTRVGALALSAVILVAGGIGIASAATSSRTTGRGVNEYGMTHAYYKGTAVEFTYTKGFYCDTSVKTASQSGCEAGANYKRPPSRHFDPLFITVPLGFTQPMSMLDCPDHLVCVDHPGHIGLGRLEPALKPLYPNLTDKQLLAALKNFPVPGHDHYITDLNNGRPEWWHVIIVGVTSQKTFDSIRAHKSYGYIHHLIKTKNKTVVGPINTNLFLFFASR